MITLCYEWAAEWHHACMRGMVLGRLRRALIAAGVSGVIASAVLMSATGRPTTQLSAVRTVSFTTTEHTTKHHAGTRQAGKRQAGKRLMAAAFPRSLLIAEPAGPAPRARLTFLPVAVARIVRALITRPTRANPWFVRIPAIGVDARLMTLGLPRSEYLPVPSLAQAFRVGWYTFTSVPGQPGNTVLVGHVDTYLGPAVFYDLYLLRPGQPIYVMLGRHHDARYFVRSVRELPKADFPTTQIFGDTHARRLWVITCGGDFDYATRHYLDNIIVSASQ
jgi:hypothetical protein